MSTSSSGNGHVSPGDGGIRGQHATTHRNSSDVRLAARALRERWPIPKEVRELAIDTLATALRDKDLRLREKVACCKVLVSASKCSQDAIRTAVFASKYGPDEVLERAQEVSRTLKDYLEETRRLAALEEAGEDIGEAP
jgi:hypothetical protein